MNAHSEALPAATYTELDASRRHEVLLGKAAELEKKHSETVKDRGSLAAENEALKVSVALCDPLFLT